MSMTDDMMRLVLDLDDVDHRHHTAAPVTVYLAQVDGHCLAPCADLASAQALLSDYRASCPGQWVAAGSGWFMTTSAGVQFHLTIVPRTIYHSQPNNADGATRATEETASPLEQSS